ncbi:MAG: hypothetical protein CMO01_26490 [Thalassobius sp.]|nr:hypothetical protein [Thalassovita sp.]
MHIKFNNIHANNKGDYIDQVTLTNLSTLKNEYYKVELRQLSIEHIDYGDYLLAYKNIFGEVEQQSFSVAKQNQELTIDVSKNFIFYEDYDFKIDNLNEGDTLTLYAKSYFSDNEQVSENKKIKFWKESNEFYCIHPVLDTTGNPLGKLSAKKNITDQLDLIRIFEAELLKMYHYQPDCTHSEAVFYFELNDNVEKYNVNTCNWDGFSRLWKQLNEISK